MALFAPVAREDYLVNGRAKLTPAGELIELVYSSRPVFCTATLEARNPEKPIRVERDGPLPENQARGANRARKRLFELALCNDFDLFITFTLSRKKVDRYDPKIIIPKLNTWLDNAVRRKGLRYIVVPERHKDGAIHFHGLMNSSALSLVDSGRVYRKDGRTIWNVKDWKYGYSTALRLNGEYGGVCRYVSKYITKQTGDMIAGRYFYSGGELYHPVVKLFNWDEKPAGVDYDVEEAGLTLTYAKIAST